MNKPLYCWKLSKDLKLEKYIIEGYEFQHWVGGDRYVFYGFLGNENASRRYVKAKNIERYIHNTYYSFVDDDAKTKENILESYKNRARKLADELDKINAVIRAIN